MTVGAAENVGDQADDTDVAKHTAPKTGLPVIALAAFGIVFGDIGTSPRYTMKTVLSATGNHVDRGTTLGDELEHVRAL